MISKWEQQMMRGVKSRIMKCLVERVGLKMHVSLTSQTTFHTQVGSVLRSTSQNVRDGLADAVMEVRKHG